MSTTHRHHQRTFTDAQRVRINHLYRINYAKRATTINDRRREIRDNRQDAVNSGERGRYQANREAINQRRRLHHDLRTMEVNAERRRRRDALLAARRNHSDFGSPSASQDDMPNLQEVLQQRQHDLYAARESRGVNIKNADPCGHRGAKFFAKESKGMWCKNGKAILARLPPLPPAMEALYSSSEPSAKEARAYSRAFTTALHCQLFFVLHNRAPPTLRHPLSVLVYCAAHVRCSNVSLVTQLCRTLQVHLMPCRPLSRRLPMLHVDSFLSLVLIPLCHIYLFSTSSHEQSFTPIIVCPPRPMGLFRTI